MIVSRQFNIMPTAPFDFDKSLKFLAGFPATQHEQRIAEGTLSKALRVQGKTVVYTVQSTGTVESPCLEVTLYSSEALADEIVKQVEARISAFLSLHEDLSAFYALAQQDDRFQQVVMPALYGYRQVKFPSPFEIAAWAVLSQRQPMAQSRLMKQRIINRYSEPLTVEGQPYTAFPEPEDFMPLDEAELTDILKNARKARYLIAVIEAFSTVDPAFLYEAPYERIKDWLLSIKGIGEWSAMFVLVRGLGRMYMALLDDAESTFNKNLMSAAKPVYGDITLDRLRDIEQQYGTWKGYWAHFLKAYNEVM